MFCSGTPARRPHELQPHVIATVVVQLWSAVVQNQTLMSVLRLEAVTLLHWPDGAAADPAADWLQPGSSARWYQRNSFEYPTNSRIYSDTRISPLSTSSACKCVRSVSVGKVHRMQ